MKLYLVQHAEARSKEEDPDRPLNKQGWAHIEEISAFVAGHVHIDLESIIHSGKLRARQTAEVLARHLGPSSGVKESDSLEPLADISVWVERLKAMEEDIMIVGHMPYLSRLASFLLCQQEDEKIIDFCNVGINCLVKDQTGNWTINWIITPRVLKKE